MPLLWLTMLKVSFGGIMNSDSNQFLSLKSRLLFISLLGACHLSILIKKLVGEMSHWDCYDDIWFWLNRPHRSQKQ